MGGGRGAAAGTSVLLGAARRVAARGMNALGGGRLPGATSADIVGARPFEKGTMK